ncbi:MAG TPA: hypothetical protein VEU73_08525 [Gemmatimonadales bacterium]|nr:hypothetical protein [Gemmatimonadales bacterium]
MVTRPPLADARESLRTNAGDMLEAAVVRCRLELLERVDPEVVMQPAGEPLAHAGHRREERQRVTLPAQSLEHRQPPGRREVADRAGEARADPGEPFETERPLALENLGHGDRQPSQCLRRARIGVHPEGVCALLGQQTRDLFEPSGDLRVQSVSHVRGPTSAIWAPCGYS